MVYCGICGKTISPGDTIRETADGFECGHQVNEAANRRPMPLCVVCGETVGLKDPWNDDPKRATHDRCLVERDDPAIPDTYPVILSAEEAHALLTELRDIRLLLVEIRKALNGRPHSMTRKGKKGKRGYTPEAPERNLSGGDPQALEHYPALKARLTRSESAGNTSCTSEEGNVTSNPGSGATSTPTVGNRKAEPPVR